MKKKEQPANIEDKIEYINRMHQKGVEYLKVGGVYLGVPITEFTKEGLVAIIKEMDDENKSMRGMPIGKF